jgi:hypothetical protein
MWPHGGAEERGTRQYQCAPHRSTFDSGLKVRWVLLSLCVQCPCLDQPNHKCCWGPSCPGFPGRQDTTTRWGQDLPHNPKALPGFQILHLHPVPALGGPPASRPIYWLASICWDPGPAFCSQPPNTHGPEGLFLGLDKCHCPGPHINPQTFIH